MMRRFLTFECGGAKLHGSLNKGAGTSGLLIVAGGSEIRSGASASHVRLAQRIAEAGFPVFRFDRRGIGDSEGHNTGFRGAAPDIKAAIAAFRAAMPGLQRIVTLGNCDAASTLMLASGVGSDALILANPWTFEEDEAANPVVHGAKTFYRRWLRRMQTFEHQLTGRDLISKWIRSIIKYLRPAQVDRLVDQMREGLWPFLGEVRILIAENDYVAQCFLEKWDAGDRRIRHCPEAGHCFMEPKAWEWLIDQLLGTLASHQQSTLFQ